MASVKTPRLVLAFTALGAFVWTEAILYSQNTLYNNDHWIVQKRTISFTPSDADSTLLTRSPLAGNVLHLESYGGHQEFLLRQVLKPRRVTMLVRVETGSYLDFTFNRDARAADARFAGLRISGSSQYPPQAYEETADGRFLSQNFSDLKRLPLLDDDWHRITLQNADERAGLLLRLDDSDPIFIRSPKMTEGRIGLRSGLLGAQVRSVDISEDDGGQIHESFKNGIGFLRLFARVLAALALMAFAFYFFKSPRSAFLAARTVLIFGGLWFSFDYFYWSRFETVAGLRSWDRPSPASAVAERARYLVFSALSGDWENADSIQKGIETRGYKLEPHPSYYFFTATRDCDAHIGEEARKELMLSRKASFRFLLLGGSQDIGVGARTLPATFFCGLHEGLNREAFGIRPVESANRSTGARSLEEQIRDYREGWAGYHPDLIMLSSLDFLSALSSGNENLLLDFLRENHAHGSKTLLLVPASDPEERNWQALLARRLERRAELTKKFAPLGGSFLDANPYLSEEKVRSSGVLWWDRWHLTEYGQKLFSDWILGQLDPKYFRNE